MNPSPSPTISNADPLRAPTAVAGVRAVQSSSEKSNDSFSTLLDSESASFEESNSNNTNNNNTLENTKDKPEEAEVAASTQDSSDPLATDESSSSRGHEENNELIASENILDDSEFETELLDGISVAFPTNTQQAPKGENLPLGGKELPLNLEVAESAARTTSPTAKSDLQSELQDADARFDRTLQNRGRSDIIGQEKVIDLDSVQLDLSSSDRKPDAAQARALPDSLAENLALLTSKSAQETTTITPATNNSAANLSALASQLDSATAQKIGLTPNTTATNELNAAARTNVDWSTAIGEKVHWMQNAKVSIAELHLHPAELGSIEIKIATEDQQARVSFITSSAAARDVIEESMPKLRDLLADSGLALDQSDISHRESDDEGASAQDGQQAPAQNHSVETETKQAFVASPTSTRIGQVDQYV